MIKKVIERFLGQIGVNVEDWYQYYKRPLNIGYNIYFHKNIKNKSIQSPLSTKKKEEHKDFFNHNNSLNKRKQDIEDKKNFLEIRKYL